MIDKNLVLQAFLASHQLALLAVVSLDMIPADQTLFDEYRHIYKGIADAIFLNDIQNLKTFISKAETLVKENETMLF